MKKTVLLATHFHSGSLGLMYQLAENPRVQCYRTNNNYDHPTVLDDIESKPHKCQHRGAVYIDEIVLNHSVRSTRILDICRIIYLVREPARSLEGIAQSKMLDPRTAVRYYCYRLRRLCEMARRTPGAVFLTHEDLITGRGLPLIEKYLYLKEPLVHDASKYPVKDILGLIPKKEAELAERAYEKYLYAFRHYPLQMVR